MLSRLRNLSHRPGLVAARASVVAVGAATAGGYVFLTTTDSGRGVRRQTFFWSRMAPVIADYYFQTASSSPYVRYQKWRNSSSSGGGRADDNQDDEYSDDRSAANVVLEKLHARHAQDVFETMLQLKGLYVKLGQVLSVTALPIPEPYRVLFRTLQSDVPGYEQFEQIKATIEADFGQSLESLYTSFDPTPVGAASIGQAHKAVDARSGADVIVKVQYRDAAWQIPSDIQCIGDLLKVCVWARVVDETAANLSFREFARQFLAELDYQKEAANLRTIYESSLQPDAPYRRRNVVVPKPFLDLCTDHVITMTYLPGPKLEEEARRQLKSIGIDIDSSRQGLRNLVGKDAPEATLNAEAPVVTMGQSIATSIGMWVGMDTMLWMARLAKTIVRAVVAVTASTVHLSSYVAPVPTDWQIWAAEQQAYRRQSQRVEITEEWIHALFDVHGHQIFILGLFNADAHPGNILVVDNNNSNNKNDSQQASVQLGLIDFGQCKRLSRSEQVRIARFLLAVANKESDETIADCFRALGVKTKRNSTNHLAKFAKLMFGPLESHHLDHKWHREMHQEDSITYFPNELGMVYRTSMLLRGLALSLQMNVSVAEEWREYLEVVSRYPLVDENELVTEHNKTNTVESAVHQQEPPLINLR
jgi:aarF domain-containing kinase